MKLSRVLPDLIRHPVETVGTRRVALGYDRQYGIAGRSPQRHESTFNILRKYFHRLTKVYSAADESTFENLLPLPPENIYLLCRRSTTYLPDEVYLL